MSLYKQKTLTTKTDSRQTEDQNNFLIKIFKYFLILQNSEFFAISL